MLYLQEVLVPYGAGALDHDPVSGQQSKRKLSEVLAVLSLSPRLSGTLSHRPRTGPWLARGPHLCTSFSLVLHFTYTVLPSNDLAQR